MPVVVFQQELAGLPLEIQVQDDLQRTQVEQRIAQPIKKIIAVSAELKLLNKNKELKNPSKELLDLLSLCDQWQEKTHSAFSCRLGALQQDWNVAALAGELPDRTALRKKSRRHLQLKWVQDQSHVQFSKEAKNEGLQLDLQGLWQGWVIGQLASVIQSSAISLSYGNLRQRFIESKSNEVISLPNISPVAVSLSQGQVLAVVDRTHNLRKVGHYSLSHVLVPNEGWPVEFAPSLLVRATNAVEAGVSMQSLLTIPAYEARLAAEKNTGVEVLTITETGKFFASQEWYGLDSAGSAPWPDSKKFQIDFEIPALDVAEYRKPYVAFWISDSQGSPVRVLHVIGDSPRWLRELRQWWRKLARNDESIIDAIAGATRKPGRYHVEWDGRDQQGNTVQAGQYVLHVEIAREHGEHENLTLPFDLNGKPIKIKQKGQQELGVVTLNLR